jgi:hypothetical protein
MRYAHAKWLIEFSERDGMGLGVVELARIEEAEFRVRGLGLPSRSDVPRVKNNMTLAEDVLPWEPELLGIVAHELISVFDPKKSGLDGE